MSEPKPHFHRLLPILLLALLAGCTGFENKRIQENSHEKGFGTRAQGDARVETYVVGGDAIQFFLSQAVYQQPVSERLYLLTQPQAVGIDGTILVPYVGAVHVLGLTEQQLATMVRGLLEPLFQFQIDLQVRIINRGKIFFAIGEVGVEGAIPMTKGDLTLYEAVHRIGWTKLANLGRIYLIRHDAEAPLVMQFNMRDMVFTGYSNTNFRVKENDTIYIPPTFLGTLARVIERLVLPINYLVNAMFGLADVRSAYDVVTGETSGGYYYRF